MPKHEHKHFLLFKEFNKVLSNNTILFYKELIVRHLTRITRLDIKYFLSGGFFAVIQQVVGIICGSILTYLQGHYISQVVFGEYNLVLSIVSLITFFSLPGLDSAVTQAVGQGKDGSLENSVITKKRFSLLGTIALIGFALYYYFEAKRTIAFALLITSVAYPFLYSFNVVTAFLTARQRFHNLSLIASLSSIFFLISMAFAIFISHSTISLIIAYLCGLIIPSAVSYIYTKRLVRNNTTPSDLISYGYFLTFVSALPWITGNLGSIFLGNNNGLQSLALFSVAMNFLVITQKIFIVFYKPITAKLAVQSNEEHWQTLKYHAWKLVLIGCLIYGLLWITLPFLIKFFYTSDYRPAIYYGRLLCLGLIPLPLSWVINDIITYEKLKYPLFISSITPHIMRLLVYTITIPFMGIVGLILSILVERLLSLLLPAGILFIRHQQIKRARINLT